MASPDDDNSGPPLEPGALKRMLARAKRTPVNAAAGVGDPKSGGSGLLLLDPVTAPKALMRTLKGQNKGASKLCFGTASVDATDPKLVTLTMNKRSTGLDRKLRAALKGSGYSKVQIKRASS